MINKLAPIVPKVLILWAGVVNFKILSVSITSIVHVLAACPDIISMPKEDVKQIPKDAQFSTQLITLVSHVFKDSIWCQTVYVFPVNS